MLGAAQERWLRNTIDRSNARWSVLAQQTRMAQSEVLSGDGERSVSLDGWDGYPAARQRLLSFIGTRKPSNPLVIGGDVHATYVGNLKPDFDDPASPVVAAEICGTSITSYGPANRQAMARRLRQNPHMLYGNGWTRGYMRMTLDRRNAVAELRGLADAQDRGSAISTVAKFAVESGRPGVTLA
jgi:alkaline phosphatase D